MRKGRLELIGGQFVVDGAELVPSTGWVCQLRNSRNVFGHDDSETKLKMPVDMAMQEPRSRIIGFESNSNVVIGTTGAHNIALDGVVEVVISHSSASHDAESMAMEMERMRASDACDVAGKECYFDNFVPCERDNAARWE